MYIKQYHIKHISEIPMLEKLTVRDLLTVIGMLGMVATAHFSQAATIQTMRYELSHWKGRTSTLESVQRADHDTLMILNSNLNNLIEKFDIFIERTDSDG